MVNVHDHIVLNYNVESKCLDIIHPGMVCRLNVCMFKEQLWGNCCTKCALVSSAPVAGYVDCRVFTHVGPVRTGRESSRPTGLCPSLYVGVNNQSCLHDLINLINLMITS